MAFVSKSESGPTECRLKVSCTTLEKQGVRNFFDLTKSPRENSYLRGHTFAESRIWGKPALFEPTVAHSQYCFVDDSNHRPTKRNVIRAHTIWGLIIHFLCPVGNDLSTTFITEPL